MSSLPSQYFNLSKLRATNFSLETLGIGSNEPNCSMTGCVVVLLRYKSRKSKYVDYGKLLGKHNIRSKVTLKS